MKRAAICLSGHVRNFEKNNINLFENIINANPDYKFDVFISTWTLRNSKKSQAVIRGEGHNRECLYDFDQVDVNKILEIYDPVVCEIEKPKDDYFEKYSKYSGINPNDLGGGNNPIALFSQFYKVKKSINLIQEYDFYDVVIRSRFDLNIQQKISLNNIDIKEDTIHIEDDKAPGWVSDKFAIMNQKTALEYARFYDNIELYIKKLNTTIHEFLFAAHIKDCGISYMKETEKIGFLRLY